MNIHRSLLLALLTGITLLAFACATSKPHEPVFQGKPLSFWMDDITNCWTEDSSKGQAPYENWTNAVRELGTNALPFYVQSLGDQKHPVRCDAASIAFQVLGTTSEAAIPDVASLLRDEKTIRIASYALVAIGPSSVPALTNAVATLTNRSRYVAISALGDLGTNAYAAKPVLIDCLRGDATTSDTALHALADIEIHAELLLPILKEYISHSNTVIGASYGLWRIGKPGIPTLLSALTNESRQVRLLAAGALRPELQDFSATNRTSISSSRLTSEFNLRAIRAAADSYQEGDFRYALQVAEKYQNDNDEAIRSAASNAIFHLTALALTNIPQIRIDEESLPSGQFKPRLAPGRAPR